MTFLHAVLKCHVGVEKGISWLTLEILPVFSAVLDQGFTVVSKMDIIILDERMVTHRSGETLIISSLSRWLADDSPARKGRVHAGEETLRYDY